ncbi:MAG: hypothetical protein MJD61_15690 [Proteobacteria bacterium]|nr:hypothetical protein [Pseudomonadota bacterium]
MRVPLCHQLVMFPLIAACGGDSGPQGIIPAGSGGAGAGSGLSCDPCTVSELAIRDGLEPCCTAANECGFEFHGATECAARGQPGTQSDVCQPLVQGLTFGLAGCCMMNGMCGIDFTPLDPNLGCVDRTKFLHQKAQPCM